MNFRNNNENLPLCFAGKCKHDRTNSSSNNSGSAAGVCQSFPDQKTQGLLASSRGQGGGGHRGGGRQRPPNLADIGRQQRLQWLRGQRNLANLKFYAYYLEGGAVHI